jgi:hypothetical protein
MTLSLEDSNLVWQKTKIALESLGADPVARAAFKALREKLAGVGGNPTLQFVPITSTDVDDANGKVLADAPCTVWGVFAKKANTATDVYLAILNDDTDDASPITDVRAVIGLPEAAETAFLIYPQGLSMSVGVVGKAYTEFDGTTDSTDTDCPNGFMLISAA